MPNKPASKLDPLRGLKTGKWTKYGGAIHGLIKESPVDFWYCQSCGREVPKEIPPFLFEMFTADFIRICNICQHTATTTHTIEIHRVIRIERKGTT